MKGRGRSCTLLFRHIVRTCVGRLTLVAFRTTSTSKLSVWLARFSWFVNKYIAVHRKIKRFNHRVSHPFQPVEHVSQHRLECVVDGGQWRLESNAWGSESFASPHLPPFLSCLPFLSNINDPFTATSPVPVRTERQIQSGKNDRYEAQGCISRAAADKGRPPSASRHQRTKTFSVRGNLKDPRLESYARWHVQSVHCACTGCTTADGSVQGGDADPRASGFHATHH